MVSFFCRARAAVWIICLAVIFAATAAAAALASPTPAVVAWGAGAEGQLGNGGNQNASTYSAMAKLTNVSGVAAGGNFGLALLAGESGTVMSWGSDAAGQLGIGSIGGTSQVPVPVPSLSDVKAVAAGGEHALALLSNGTVESWGAAGLDVPGSSTPKQVPGITDAVAIAAGAEDTKAADNGADYLALLADGEVVAWGAGEEGQLGDGSTENSATPMTVRNLEHVTAISAGDGQNLALLEDGTVESWGENSDGQLGDGNIKNADEPVPVEDLSDAIAISAGDKDSLALLAGGEVKAWGDDSEGELGPLAEGDSSAPVPVGGLSGVAAISASTRSGVDINGIHNVALLSDGNVMAWGGNKEGQLGDGTEGGSSATPVEVSGLTGVTGIAAGASDAFAIGPPVPIVTGVAPATGHAGTRVHITGVNLEGATSAGFESSSTSAIEEDTSTSLYAIAPSGKPHTVQVTVTTAVGTSAATGEGSFRYQPEGPLEFGRCLSVGKRKGDYKKGCTLIDSGGGYEWSPEFQSPGFTLASKGAELASASAALIVCGGAGGGSGEYAGGKSVANVTVTFTGCAVSKRKHATVCTSPGDPAGDIQTSTLEGAAGFTNRELDDVALELLPAQEGTPFMTFTCGATTTEVRGAALATFSPVNSSAVKFSVKFAETRGKQHPEGFEEGPAEVLEASAGGGPFEQVGLTDSITVDNTEAVELNSEI